MHMPVPPETVEYYQQTILTNRRVAMQQLAHLANTEHTQFIELCHQLLSSSSVPIRWVAFSLLGQKGDGNDQLAEAKAFTTRAFKDCACRFC